MDIEEYNAALKKVKAESKQESHVLFSFGYDKNYVIPYKQVPALLTALEGAYKFQENYDKPPTIEHIRSDDLSIRPFSQKELEQAKVAALLQVSLRTLRDI